MEDEAPDDGVVDAMGDLRADLIKALERCGVRMHANLYAGFLIKYGCEAVDDLSRLSEDALVSYGLAQIPARKIVDRYNPDPGAFGARDNSTQGAAREEPGAYTADTRHQEGIGEGEGALEEQLASLDLIGGLPNRVDDAHFSSSYEVFEFFESALPQNLDKMHLDNVMINSEECPLLNVPIPCRPNAAGLKIPDMLQLELPETFPNHGRASTVSQWLLKEKVVFAPAVSGAGKTRLAFDIARRHYMLYFDCNGGHGKVQQGDMAKFHDKCTAADGMLTNLAWRNRGPTTSDRDAAFDRPIRALFVSRLIMLRFLQEKDKDLNPWKWLLLQIHAPTLCEDLFEACFKLSKQGCEKVCKALLDPTSPVFVTLDEAQALMQDHYWWWYPSQSESPSDGRRLSISKHEELKRRPLGKRVLQVLTNLGLKSVYVGATDIRVKSYETWASGVGQNLDEGRCVQFHTFDFMGGPISSSADAAAAPEEGNSNFPNLWQNGVCQFLEHCFKTAEGSDLALHSVGGTLLGRPRFVAAFAANVVTQLLEHKGNDLSGDDFALLLQEELHKYVDLQMSVTASGAIGSQWERILDDAGETVRQGDAGPVTAWELAKPLLLDSVVSRESREVSATVSNNPDLVSRGIALLSPTGDHQFIVEPLVMSVGLSVCARRKVDLMADLVALFCNRDLSDSQHLSLIHISEPTRPY
eukprot:TRINITY_DN404_c0_g1_i14.p1 TRINITY_DN404_c0_g1~~TRINITY_DN404_c0_g1_i14.p1  ORF type:complete len:697 (-),score=109.70 TRINITY_DN404_c0_g1_i14:131-2221(-)